MRPETFKILEDTKKCSDVTPNYKASIHQRKHHTKTTYKTKESV